jgi:hypothetical protein
MRPFVLVIVPHDPMYLVVRLPVLYVVDGEEWSRQLQQEQCLDLELHYRVLVNYQNVVVE